MVRLGVPGIVHGVVVDTAFFKGNYPPYVSAEATSIEGYPTAAKLEQVPWSTLVEKSPCDGDTENYFEVDDPHRWTHIRLTIYPDGGVARFRVHGEVVLYPRYLTTTVDLLALENGGRLLSTSDAFCSTPENLILSSRARLMGEGWENARRRGPGNDWAQFKLAARGEPTLIEVAPPTSSATPPAPYGCRSPTTPSDPSTSSAPGGTWWP